MDAQVKEALESVEHHLAHACIAITNALAHAENPPHAVMLTNWGNTVMRTLADVRSQLEHPAEG